MSQKHSISPEPRLSPSKKRLKSSKLPEDKEDVAFRRSVRLATKARQTQKETGNSITESAIVNSTPGVDSAVIELTQLVFCSRCKELGFPAILPLIEPNLRKSSLSNIPQDYVNKVVQRLVFDFDKSLMPECTSCKLLEEAVAYHIFVNSPQEHRSWLQLGRDQGLRCVRQDDPDSHNMGTLIVGRSGWGGYWETDVMKPLMITDTPSDLTSERYARRVLPNKINYPSLRNSLSLCVTQHSKCTPLWTPELKTINLIDVEARKLIRYPAHGKCAYVALSYVWGDTQPYQFQMGHITDKLPATINDAIQVVRELDLRYLWVDAVCIDQADLVHKAALIKIMDSIYSGAHATIIAVDAESADRGLPRVSAANSGVEQRRAIFGQNQLVSCLPPLQEQLEYSLWKTRGWTFQEGIFSRRCLYFTRHQVYFNCHGMTCCESSENIESRNHNKLNGGTRRTAMVNPILDIAYHCSSKRKHSLFGGFIGQYVSRDFSKEGDVLDAVAGLLRQFEKTLFPQGFHFGLPKYDFRQSLAWRNHGQSWSWKEIRRSRFPSWSWTGWQLKGPIHLHDRLDLEQPPLSIWTKHGEGLPVDHTFSEEYSDLDDSDGPGSKAVSFIHDFFEGLKLNPASEQKNYPGIIDSSVLTVMGVLLQLKFVVSHNRNGYCSLGGLQCDFETCNGQELQGLAYINGDQDKFKQKNVSIFANTVFPSPPQDFLLLSLSSNMEWSLNLNLILLEWKNGIAYRRGIVYAWLEDSDLPSLYECNPRKSRFLLG